MYILLKLFFIINLYKLIRDVIIEFLVYMCYNIIRSQCYRIPGMIPWTFELRIYVGTLTSILLPTFY